MTRRSQKAFGLSLALFLLWMVGYPLWITLLDALGLTGAGTVGTVERWSNFGEFIGRADEWRALWRSVWISVASTVLAGAVGIPLAFVFERLEFPGRRVLGGLVALPVALPPLVGVIAFLFLYGESGFLTRGLQMALGLESAPWRLQGPGAILLVHTYSMYVYFYLFTRSALSRLDAAFIEAAASLGAGRLRTLWRVVFPLLRPATTGAALLAFMTSLASFSAPYIFGGGFRVMTTQILASKLNGELGMAQMEAMTLAAVALLGLWGMRRMDRHSGEVVGGVRGVTPARRRLQRKWARWGATLLGWGMAVFLLLPHLTLLLISFVPPSTWTVEQVPPILNLDNYRSLMDSPERLRPIVNSLWMAGVATAGALLLGFLAANYAVRWRGRLGSVLETLIAIPWAIPGTVFAVSLATAFSVHSPVTGRFILVGTPWILPLAYLVRGLPLTGRSSLAGLRQFDRSLEEAARGMGASVLRTAWRVTLPLLRPALLAGAGLVFITALGDLVTSVVLYTYDTRPISIEILSSLRLQETGVAAVYGVLLMVLSGLVFTLWGKEPGVAG